MSFPHLKQAYVDLYTTHVSRIIHAVVENIADSIGLENRPAGERFRRFFESKTSKRLDPAIIAYSMHYGPLTTEKEDCSGDNAVFEISPPHLDMSAITILPRGTSCGTLGVKPDNSLTEVIYDRSIPDDALLVFNGFTIQKLCEGLTLRKIDATSQRPLFSAFKHAVIINKHQAMKDRDTIGFFVNGERNSPYRSAFNERDFSSVFLDRRSETLKASDPLPKPMTVETRQYLTERLFHSEQSPNAARPPITWPEFSRNNELVSRLNIGLRAEHRTRTSSAAAGLRWERNHRTVRTA